MKEVRPMFPLCRERTAAIFNPSMELVPRSSGEKAKKGIAFCFFLTSFGPYLKVRVSAPAWLSPFLDFCEFAIRSGIDRLLEKPYLFDFHSAFRLPDLVLMNHPVAVALCR